MGWNGQFRNFRHLLNSNTITILVQQIAEVLQQVYSWQWKTTINFLYMNQELRWKDNQIHMAWYVVFCFSACLLQAIWLLYSLISAGDYKHWTRDPRTRGPGIQGLGTRQPSSVALSFDRNGTCVNFLSSSVYGCIVVSQRDHIVIHTKTLFTSDCGILHYLLAFFINSLLCKHKNSFLYCMQDYKLH